MTATAKPVLVPEHLLNKQIFQCITTAQFASVIGNICEITRQFIIGLFPPDSIKYVHFDTTHLSNAHERLGNVIKKDKPYMVLRPKFDLGANTMLQDGIKEWAEGAAWIYQNPDGYTPIIEDRDNGYSIYYIPDRIKVTISIEIVCETLMEELNLGVYLRNSIQHKRPFYLYKQELEAVVPKKFIESLADIFHYDLMNPQDRETFRSYLDQHSIRPITEKISTSSGRPHFYYPHTCHLLCNFEDYPNIDEGNEKGQIKTDFRLTDEFSVETWVPMNYIMIGESYKFDNINEILNSHDNTNPVDDMNSIYLSQAFPYDIAPDKLANGMTKIVDMTYLIDDPKTFNPNYDIVDFSEVIPFKERDIIRYIKIYNLNIRNFFELRIYGANERQRLDILQCKIDWDRFKILNRYPRLGGKYKLVIYEDMEKCNRIYRRVHHDLRRRESYQGIPLQKETGLKVHDLNNIKIVRPKFDDLIIDNKEEKS